MPPRPLHLDPAHLVDHKLPLTGDATHVDAHGYTAMPKPLAAALTGVRAVRVRLHNTYRDAHGGIYLLQYDVPLGTGTSFLRVVVLGRHERHAFRSYCRVKSVAAYVLVFPAALCLAEQRALLDRLAATEVRKGLDGRGATVYKDVMTDLGVVRGWVQRIRAPGVLVVTVDAYNATYRATLHPTRPAYIELGAAAGVEAVEATPATLATLSSYGLPNVDVKPLDGTHVVHREEHLDKAKASWRPSRGVKLQPVVARWHLERYLHSPDRLAVVALTPTNRYLDPHERPRDETATPEEARVPVAGDVVVGGVLFRLHRFDARAKRTTRRRRPSSSAAATASRRASSAASAAAMANRPTSIELRALAVDHAFDEDARGRTGSPDTVHDGIKYRLLAAAVQRARAVYGDHDIVYVGPDPATRAVLRTFGFKAMTASAAKGASAWWTNATRRLGLRAETAPLVYRATTLQCTTWDECLQLVRERYPEKSLKECMLKAKDFYTANGRTGTSSRSSRKRSHRPVSANVGKALLLDFYNRKHLVPHGLDRRTTAFKRLFDPARDDDPSVKAARAHVRAFCTAIRYHLEHRRTTSEVLAAESGRTWLYRPDPKHPTRGGPDAYYLAELHKGSEPGATVYRFPLGRRGTPGVLGVEAGGSG